MVLDCHMGQDLHNSIWWYLLGHWNKGEKETEKTKQNKI